MQEGTELVDSQCETVQREVSNNHHSRSDSNIGSIQHSMGCIMSESPHWSRGVWNKEESEIHINILELTAADFTLRIFCKDKQDPHVHQHLHSTSALSYITKMGETKSLDLFLAAKSLWEFCPENNITLTADYLPGVLNKVSDWESRNQNSHSEWKLKPEIFHQIHKILCPL